VVVCKPKFAESCCNVRIELRTTYVFRSINILS
jgi:hypothetical protein